MLVWSMQVAALWCNPKIVRLCVCGIVRSFVHSFIVGIYSYMLQCNYALLCFFFISIILQCLCRTRKMYTAYTIQCGIYVRVHTLLNRKSGHGPIHEGWRLLIVKNQRSIIRYTIYRCIEVMWGNSFTKMSSKIVEIVKM